MGYGYQQAYCTTQRVCIKSWCTCTNKEFATNCLCRNWFQAQVPWLDIKFAYHLNSYVTVICFEKAQTAVVCKTQTPVSYLLCLLWLQAAEYNWSIGLTENHWMEGKLCWTVSQGLRQTRWAALRLVFESLDLRRNRWVRQIKQNNSFLPDSKDIKIFQERRRHVYRVKENTAATENLKPVIHLLTVSPPEQIFSLCTYPSLCILGIIFSSWHIPSLLPSRPQNIYPLSLLPKHGILHRSNYYFMHIHRCNLLSS